MKRLFFVVSFIFLFIFSAKIVSADMRITLPHGISVEIPQERMRIKTQDELDLIASEKRKLMKEQGIEGLTDGQTLIFTAIAYPSTAYALVEISIKTPPDLLIGDFNDDSLSDKGLKDLAPIFTEFIRNMVKKTGNELVGSVDMRVIPFAGYKAMSMKFRRTGLDGTVNVESLTIGTIDKTFNVVLSYRESEEYWIPLIKRIRDSIKCE